MKSHSRFNENLIYIKSIVVLIFVFTFFLQTSCKKLVEIPPPKNSITTAKVFADSADATSAIEGIYTSLNASYLYIYFGNGEISINVGSSSDELLPFLSSGDHLSTNTLTASNASVTSDLWIYPYQYLYQINASIEGLQSSQGISPTTKSELIGEAKFLRSFCYFYLVNLFGDVPLITTSDYRSNAIAARTPKDLVYNAIISDLKDAKNSLPDNFSAGGGERIRANKGAATALLARVYLYQKQWANAEKEASEIINNTSTYRLDSLNGVFLANSGEAILQWKTNPLNSANVVPEGYALIPYDNTTNPYYYITDELLNAFEPGDQRKIKWTGNTTYAGQVYYYPFKYNTGAAQISSSLSPSQYYMVLREAEQYLIRSEARTQQNANLGGAISDLNIIRNRAGLQNLPSTLNQAQVLAAIMQERRIEFFAEWGNRWLDLKRTGQARAVLSVIPYKSAWQDFQQLYPIPLSEILLDPNLKQNPGY